MVFSRRVFAFGSLAAASLATLGCSASSSSLPLRTYPMGDRVPVGHYVYIVYDTEWLTQLGEGLTARIPENRFFLVRLSVLNNGGEETIVPTITLQDDAGHTYTELSDGQQVPQWVGSVRPLRPASLMQGHVVFDVPPAHYVMRVQDEERTQEALVDLPLTFSHESPPDLPAAVPQQ